MSLVPLCEIHFLLKKQKSIKLVLLHVASMHITAIHLYIQSTLHNSDRFYPDFCIFRTELLSPISVLLKCNTEKVST